MRPWQDMRLGVIVLLLGSVAYGQDCWTNTAGRSFLAELISLTDTHATFVMSTGETNVIMLGALSSASQKTARDAHHMPEVPNQLQSTFKICQRDLGRIGDLHADGRLDAEQYKEAMEKIFSGFMAMCEKHGLPMAEYPALKLRLLSSVARTLGSDHDNSSIHP